MSLSENISDAFKECVALRAQRDDLQARNSELVEQRRGGESKP